MPLHAYYDARIGRKLSIFAHCSLSSCSQSQSSLCTQNLWLQHAVIQSCLDQSMHTSLSANTLYVFQYLTGFPHSFISKFALSQLLPIILLHFCLMRTNRSCMMLTRCSAPLFQQNGRCVTGKKIITTHSLLPFHHREGE